MKSHSKLSLVVSVFVLLTLFLSVAENNIALAATGTLPAEVQKIYDRTDKAVVDGRPGAFWVWGPRLQDNQEPYTESPAGQRSVFYFEKGRLEITDPNKSPADQYFVTSGLLLREMITGAVQQGNNKFQQREPAVVPLAGDIPATLPESPTYASLQNLVSFDGSWKSSNFTGQPVNLSLRYSGQVTSQPELANGVTYGRYYSETGHNVAQPFITFMEQSGTVYENGSYKTNQPLFNPLYVFGFPISEPYWTRVTVGGTAKNVLVQAFERRLLTYTPDNADPYKVELGNLGLAYTRWRYQTTPATFSNADPAVNKPTATQGFNYYNQSTNSMRTLSAVKRVITQNGRYVGEQAFQAPNRARTLEQSVYRGAPVTVEAIYIGALIYLRLIDQNGGGDSLDNNRTRHPL